MKVLSIKFILFLLVIVSILQKGYDHVILAMQILIVVTLFDDLKEWITKRNSKNDE